MIIIRDASEDEMIWAFLNMEYQSERFHDDIDSVLNKNGIDKQMICENYSDDDDDKKLLRRKLLSEYRGYPDSEIFENYPRNMDWKLARMEKGDIEKLRYIDYSYWNELSGGTSKPSDGAAAVLRGTEIFGVSNDGFMSGYEALSSGVTFPPLILLAYDEEKYRILEGHLRATVYGMMENGENGAFAYIGYCGK